MADLPREAEALLAAAPEVFVEERTRVARALRDEGRAGDARVVEALKKPPAVVLALNRAARDRPQAARDAADAAGRLARAQLEGAPGSYREALQDLERASALLADVADAHLSRGRGAASESMRRRVRELVRGALAHEPTRADLVRGALVEELPATGFGAFEGVELPATKRRRATGTESRSKRDDDGERRARRRVLEAEVAEARRALRAAERRAEEAVRERDAAAEALADLEAKLDRA